MRISDYTIWDNPNKKDVSISSQEKLTSPKWLVPQKVEYILDGSPKSWECVPRNENTDVVAVLPITSDNKIILIEERRVPFMSETHSGKVISLPAGLVDTGEDGSVAALREMQEEIGFSSDSIRYATRVTSSEGITNEEVSIYIARQCEKIQQALDGYEYVNGLFLRHESGEIIDKIHAVPYKKVDDFLELCAQEGMKRGSKIDSALRAYERKFFP